MEKDDELKGEGNSYDFGARMLDPRVGRWFAPDPLESNFPFESPYVFASNNPIIYIDSEGERKFLTINILDEETGIRTEIKIVIDEHALKRVRRDVGPKGHAEYVYDWHDINITQNVIRKSDGTFVMDGSSSETLGDKRTTTLWDWGEGFANKQANFGDFLSRKEQPSKYEGGIAWYSKDGQGEEVRIGNKENVPFEEGESLISALKKGRGFGKKGPKLPYPTTVKGKFDDDQLNAIKKIYDKSMEIVSEIDKVKKVYENLKKVTIEISDPVISPALGENGKYKEATIHESNVRDTTLGKSEATKLRQDISKKRDSLKNEISSNK